jgi:hypothetical protein
MLTSVKQNPAEWDNLLLSLLTTSKIFTGGRQIQKWGQENQTAGVLEQALNKGKKRIGEYCRIEKERIKFNQLCAADAFVY